MYKYLKLLQAVAEEIGEVKGIQLHDGDKIWGDGITIKGETVNGKFFNLELSIEEKKDADF